MHVTPEENRIIVSILKQYLHYGWYAFGSRARGDNALFSDLDLCHMQPLPWEARSAIAEAFEKSNLPFQVDIIDWARCSEEFKDIIKNDMKKIDL